MDEVILLGSINKDKKLEAVFTPEYRALMQRCAGRQVMINIIVMPEQRTVLQITYFKKVVLPCVQRGFRSTGDNMSLKETEERVISMCPDTADIEPSEELTKEQMSRLIEWCIQICAFNFGIIVPEPIGHE